MDCESNINIIKDDVPERCETVSLTDDGGAARGVREEVRGEEQ